MVCFAMLRGPRTSTLFPYTTLFRSRTAESWGSARASLQLPVDLVIADRQLERRDRKSTRLNSSHRCISYAVFCLKKKIDNNSPPMVYRDTVIVPPALEQVLSALSMR